MQWLLGAGLSRQFFVYLFVSYIGVLPCHARKDPPNTVSDQSAILFVPRDEESRRMGFLPTLVSFLGENFGLTPASIHPRDPMGGYPRELNDAVAFRLVLEQRLRELRAVPGPVELTLLFFTHGQIQKDAARPGEKFLTLQTHPAEGALVNQPWSDFLAIIEEQIAAHPDLSQRLRLNLGVGACYAGQCVQDFAKHSLAKSMVPIAILGLVDDAQETYRKLYVPLLLTAVTVERRLKERGIVFCEGCSQFERVGRILSASPIRFQDRYFDFVAKLPFQSAGFVERPPEELIRELLQLATVWDAFPQAVDWLLGVHASLLKIRQDPALAAAMDLMLQTEFRDEPVAHYLQAILQKPQASALSAILRLNSDSSAAKLAVGSLGRVEERRLEQMEISELHSLTALRGLRFLAAGDPISDLQFRALWTQRHYSGMAPNEFFTYLFERVDPMVYHSLVFRLAREGSAAKVMHALNNFYREALKTRSRHQYVRFASLLIACLSTGSLELRWRAVEIVEQIELSEMEEKKAFLEIVTELDQSQHLLPQETAMLLRVREYLQPTTSVYLNARLPNVRSAWERVRDRDAHPEISDTFFTKTFLEIRKRLHWELCQRRLLPAANSN